MAGGFIGFMGSLRVIHVCKLSIEFQVTQNDVSEPTLQHPFTKSQEQMWTIYVLQNNFHQMHKCFKSIQQCDSFSSIP